MHSRYETYRIALALLKPRIEAACFSRYNQCVGRETFSGRNLENRKEIRQRNSVQMR